MPFVGKIFTVLIFLFSLVFMAFAVTVYQTRKNWYDVVMVKKATDEKPLGLRYQVKNKDARIKELDQLNEDKDNLRASVEAAHLQAIAKLQTQLAEERQTNGTLSGQLATAQKSSSDAITKLGNAENRSRQLTAEVVGLRREIRDTQSQRDGLFSEMVQLTDGVHQRDLQLAELRERGIQVAAQVQRMRDVLQHNGLNENTSLTDEPPVLDGVVTDVTRTGLIEVSLGSDDGLRVNHKLDVYRENQYVGKIQVTEIRSDKAVCIELPDFRKHRIRRRDRVKTKIKEQVQ